MLTLKNINSQLGKKKKGEKEKKKPQQKLCTLCMQQAVTQEIPSTHSLQRAELPAP